MYSRVSFVMWYHGLFGANKKAAKALEHYGSFERLYEIVTQDADREGLLKGFTRQQLTSYSLFDASETVAQCEDMGGEVITFDSPYYPGALLEIKDYPLLLFCHGDKEILKEKLAVAIVGSRDAPDEALALSYCAAYNMAKSGAVIVSGAATGIDTAAHKGAVAAGGATVGVLGCGLGHEYMDRLGNFYDSMCRSGVLITEMLPFERPSRYSFPKRNRMISGMSRAVLVGFAGRKSGSLITAGTAKKQGRRVYAIASELCESEGCSQLIDDGAFVFYNAGDIIYPLKDYCADKFDEIYCNKPLKTEGVTPEDFSVVYDTASEVQTDTPVRKKSSVKKKAEKTEKTVPSEPVSEKKEIPDFVSDDAKKVYGALNENAVEVNSLVSLTGISIQNILAAVSELEIFGLVKSLPGMKVIRAQ